MNTTSFPTDNQAVTSSINRFFRSFAISRIAYRCGIRKKAGIPVLTILLTLFSLPFLGQNTYRFFSQSDAPYNKDALYTLLRSPNISWRLFQRKIALAVVSFFKSLMKKDAQSVLIIDDSLLERPRTKKAELCSRVYDHVSNTYTKGYRFLCLGWSDGTSFVPIDFAVLASKKVKNLLCGARKKLDARTSGAKRRSEATKTAPFLCVQMLERAKKSGIKAKYVLMGAWFGLPSVITACAKVFHVICMVKKTSKIHYRTKNGLMSANHIFRALKKRPGKAKWLSSTIVTLKTGIEVRLIFVRHRNNRKKYLIFLSTDTTLPEDEVLRLYGLRWDIEVFFRTIKQHLNFAKGFQGRDFDGIVGYASIVMLRYIFLSVEQRRQKDPRSLGRLFYACCTEMKEITAFESLIRILGIACTELQEKQLDTKVMDTIFDTIINCALRQYGFLEPHNKTSQGLAA